MIVAALYGVLSRKESGDHQEQPQPARQRTREHVARVVHPPVEQALQHDSTAGQAQGDYLPVADRVRALRNNADAPAAAGCRGL